MSIRDNMNIYEAITKLNKTNIEGRTPVTGVLYVESMNDCVCFGGQEKMEYNVTTYNACNCDCACSACL